MGIEGPYPCEWYFLPLNPACSTTSSTSTTTTLIPVVTCLNYLMYVYPDAEPATLEFENCDNTESSIIIVYPGVTASFCAKIGTVHITGHAQISVIGVCPTTTSTTSTTSLTTTTSTTGIPTTTTTSTTEEEITTTTTTLCYRPEGLSNTYMLYYLSGDDLVPPGYHFFGDSPWIDVCTLWQDFVTIGVITGHQLGAGAFPIQYNIIEIGQYMYKNFGLIYPNSCETIQDGTYIASSTVQATEIQELTEVAIVTIVSGYITSINTCYAPTTTTTTTII
jgi:hypothetical protein